MAKTKNKPVQVRITAKCVGCKKVSELTEKQIQEAQRDGAAISTCCFMPMVVESAQLRRKGLITK